MALAGALLPLAAGLQFTLPWTLWLYIVGAFMGARSAGMALNHLIDARFDARNPRTAGRPIPTGRASPRKALLIACGSYSLYFLCCWLIQPLLFWLAWPAALLIALYSYTKRFTSFCHLVLGLVQFCAPVYAYIAVTGGLTAPPLLLGVALMAWIAAHDIVYAMQDVEFDRSAGLYSIPSRLGPRGSQLVVFLLQGIAVAALLGAGWLASLPAVYFLAVSLLALHFLLWGRRAIFWSNALASAIVLAGIVGSIVWQSIH
jgi:4-hydroxybenzoate polyprenyltransferase